MGLPGAGVMAATVVGGAVAAAVHRSGVIEPDSFELMPDARAPDFDEAAAGVSRRGHARCRVVGSVDDEGSKDALAGLAATGICPTLEVEAELARAIAAQPTRGTVPEPDRDLTLSASRA
jgi:hypothetical protein